MTAENPLLQFEPGLMIWTVVVFLVTLAVLTRIAWKPLLRALDEREKRITDALSKAEQAQREADEAIAEARRDAAAAHQRSEDLVREAKAAAERFRQNILDEAKVESQKLLDQGLRRIEVEQRAAAREIRRSAAELAIQAANRLIRSSLDESGQRAIVEEFLTETPTDRVQ